jgi:predicted amidohydrolase
VPTGRAHWEVLIRARAIETGAFVLAAAQAGHHADGRETWGHALAVDPMGGVLADLGQSVLRYSISARRSASERSSLKEWPPLP